MHHSSAFVERTGIFHAADDSPALSHPDTEETAKSPKRRCTEVLETSSDEPVTLKTPSTSSLQSHQVLFSYVLLVFVKYKVPLFKCQCTCI